MNSIESMQKRRRWNWTLKMFLKGMLVLLIFALCVAVTWPFMEIRNLAFSWPVILEAVGGAIIIFVLGAIAIALVMYGLSGVVNEIRSTLRLDPICDIEGHCWRGCKCVNEGCKESNHKFIGCECLNCHIITHQWKGCICSRAGCGANKHEVVRDPHCRCKWCDETLHVWSNWQSTSLSCKMSHFCIHCNLTEEKQEHSWGAWTVNQEGGEERVCLRCRTHEKRETEYVSILETSQSTKDNACSSSAHSAASSVIEKQGGTYLETLTVDQLNKLLDKYQREDGRKWFPELLKQVDDEPDFMASYIHWVLHHLSSSLRYWITLGPDYRRIDPKFAALFAAWLRDPEVVYRSIAETIQHALMKTDAKCYKLEPNSREAWLEWLAKGEW